ncbi:MAG: peptidylprolyl isomerase [Cyclobacteriaceae bacterium]
MKNTLLFLGLAFLSLACSTEKDYLITFHTPYGEMKAVLYDATPEHKRNFIELARQGKYDSTIFHRVIEDFMVQGGDLSTAPGYNPEEDSIDYTIPAEFVDTLFHKKGAIAAARQGDGVNPERASSGSQFYFVQGVVYDEEQLTTDMNQLGKGIQNLLRIPEYQSMGDTLMALYQSGDMDAYTNKMMELKTLVEEEFNIDLSRKYPQERIEAYTSVGGTPHLDDTYTVFGQVIEGLAVVDSIAAQPTGPADKPLKDIYVRVEVEEVAKKKISRDYGFQYPEE